MVFDIFPIKRFDSVRIFSLFPSVIQILSLNHESELSSKVNCIRYPSWLIRYDGWPDMGRGVRVGATNDDQYY